MDDESHTSSDLFLSTETSAGVLWNTSVGVSYWDHSLYTTGDPLLFGGDTSANETLAIEEDLLDKPPFLPTDNPENIISLETYLLLDEIVYCGICPVLFLVGVPSNVLNCIVFFRQGIRDRMNMCLFSLALVDMSFVFTFFLHGSHCLVGRFRPDLKSWWDFTMRKNFTGLQRGFLISSGCLTMIIAVERCLCVTLPLKASILIKTRTLAVIILTTVVSIQAASLVYPLIIFGNRSGGGGGNKTAVSHLTRYQRSEIEIALVNIVNNTLLKIVIPFTTFIAVSIATAITVIQLKRAITWRETSGSESGGFTGRQRALVKMLVIVSLVYIITAAPNIILGIAGLTVPGFESSGRYANLFLTARLWPGTLAMLNSSVNFFIYMSRSSKYREQLLAIFFREARNDQLSSVELSTTTKI
nr:hypothetical protein BaRGS_020752 [Batillaria attramentaria]